MATRAGNIKGIKFLEEPLGSEKGGVALVTFDLVNTVFTGGADTITLGGAGTDQGVATTLTLAQMIQNRRRDGKTVTITGVAAASVFPGSQTAATNGPSIFVQAAAQSGGNVTSMTLNTATTAGSAVTTTAAAWDRAAGIAVSYVAI